jgi:pimeloyl-ACP methyl ester carboxylesterase
MALQHFTEQVGSIRMHYVLEGSGPLVVLLHGFPEFWWSWRLQIAPLVEAGYRVAAPDLRGYNETERSGPYDLDTLASDVAALVEHLGESRATIVGHDWGGVITWHIASTRPEICERAVVMNAPHPAAFKHAILHSFRQIRRSWYMFFFLLPWLPELRLQKDGARLIKRIYLANAVDRSNFTDAAVRPFREAMAKPGAATAAIGYYRAAFRYALTKGASVARSPVIKQQTLLIWGKDDRALDYEELVPPTSRWVPNLRIEPIERCGHFVHQERPEVVNGLLIDFLRRRAVR